jgi:hypothetical protein
MAICSPVFQSQTRPSMSPLKIKTRSPWMRKSKPPKIERECIVPPLVVRGWTPPVESVQTWMVDELKIECSYRQ